MKIHHIGYLVSDLNAAIKAFEYRGGVFDGNIIFDSDRLIDIAFIQMDTYLLELVFPHEGSEAVGRALKRLKNTPYHLCFECDDIDKTIDEQVSNGCMVVEGPKKAVAIENKRVAFLYSAQIGLFEIVETRHGNGTY